MADVYGDLGGNPIELNNAATETTLKQLLAVMMAMSAGGKGGKGGKAQAELEKELKRLADQTKDLNKKRQDELKLLDEGKKRAATRAKAEEDQLKQAEANSQALGAMAGAAMGAATKLTSMISALANTGNSLTQAAASLQQIPVVGGALASVFGAVAGAAEKTYKSFQQAAEVGANFGGSITDMIDAATGAGLTFDQFSGIIARTGQSLALLGGSTAEGAKRLAQLGRGIKDTELGDQLARMGYSTEQINEGMANYAGRLAKTGHLQGMNNAQLIESTGQYLKNLDAVSKLTGQSKKELEDARAARMKDAQFRMIASKMDAKSQEELNKLMDSIPAEHREGMKEIIATGTATSEAGKAALAFLPETAGQMMGLNKQIRATGKMGADQAARINASYQAEASRVAKSGLGETLSYFGTDAQKQFMIGAMDAAARQKNLKQVEEERLKQEKKAAELQAQGLDPAKLKEYQEQISQVSNRFTKLLATSGLLEGMMSVFEGMVSFISTFLVPVFQFMGDNMQVLGVALGALAAVVIYATVVSKIKAMKEMLMMAPMAMVAIKFIALAAGVYLVYKGLKYLWEGMADFKDGLLSLLPKWMGGISKEEAEKRKKDRAEAKAKEENTKATEKSTELKQQENKQTKEAVETTAKYDFTSPAKLFESAARRAGSAAQQPGATAAGPAPAAMTKGATQDALRSQLASQGITDPKAVANIMAQVQAESGFKPQDENLKYSGKKLFELYGAGNKGGNKVRFKTVEEAEAVAAKGPEAVGNVIYGGRMGNREDEGFKYRGRGLIQLTGKDNYKKFGDMIGVDLVKNPDLANDPAIASKIAAAYFAEKQKKGVDLTNIAAVGKAVGYAGGQAETAKRAQLAQGFMTGGSTAATPSSTQVAAATAKPVETKPATTVAASGAGAPGAGGVASLNDVVASLQSLNMQMAQLVATNRQVVDLNRKQLGVQKSLGGDMFSVAAA